MIKASFSYNKESGIVAASVEGHAGQAKKGHDLVCSAASILAYTLAKYVESVDNAGGLKEPPHIEAEDGYMLIEAKPTEEYLAEVLNAYFVAELGFHLLSQNYPQYVELKMFGLA